MDQDQYVKVNIKEGVRAKLKEQAKVKGMTLADYIEFLANQPTQPAQSEQSEADRLLDDLSNQYDHPETSLTPEDQKLFSSLEPGELPECCQEYFQDGTKCRHWQKTYVNYYGRSVLGYRNILTGGSHFDYQAKYMQ